jgi:hypothetical protein
MVGLSVVGLWIRVLKKAEASVGAVLRNLVWIESRDEFVWYRRKEVPVYVS